MQQKICNLIPRSKYEPVKTVKSVWLDFTVFFNRLFESYSNKAFKKFIHFIKIAFDYFKPFLEGV